MELSDHSVNLLLIVGNAARRIEREECARAAEKGGTPEEIAARIRARKSED